MRAARIWALALATAIIPAWARADCKLLQLAEFHLDPTFAEPVVDGAINGHPIKVMFDTGSSFSLIPRHEAGELGLTLTPLAGDRAYGVGGGTDVYAVRLKTLQIDKFESTNPPELRVAGDQDAPSGVSLVLGDDFFSKTDVELDLADKVVRLFKPEGCQPPQLIYWGAAYSQAAMLGWERDQPNVEAIASLNGKPVLAMLDTGATQSAVDVNVADADGVPRPSAPEGAMHGMGPRPVGKWSGQFDAFAFGDEQIRHVRIVVASLVSGFDVTETGSLVPSRVRDTPQMLIGDDFLRAHRVYLDVRDHLILFSYQGGPVFATPKPPP